MWETIPSSLQTHLVWRPQHYRHRFCVFYSLNYASTRREALVLRRAEEAEAEVMVAVPHRRKEEARALAAVAPAAIRQIATWAGAAVAESTIRLQGSTRIHVYWLPSVVLRSEMKKYGPTG